MIHVCSGTAPVSTYTVKLCTKSSRELNSTIKAAVASNTTKQICTLQFMSRGLIITEFEIENSENEGEKKKEIRMKEAIVRML